MSRLAMWSAPRLIAAAVGAAVAVNLILYALGRVAGGTYEFTSSGTATEVTAITVAGFSAIPLAIGLSLAVTLGRPWPRLVGVAQIAVPILAILTIFVMTLPADLDGASTLALAACHCALIPPAALVLGEVRRRHASPAARRQPNQSGANLGFYRLRLRGRSGGSDDL